MDSIRWKQRYNNFSNTLQILVQNFHSNLLEDFSELEQIGLAKSFELCFELLWKLLKDYMEHESVEIGLLSPNNVLKAAASCGLLQQMDVDGDVLMAAHKARNALVHVYSRDIFVSTLSDVEKYYLPEFNKVGVYFAWKQSE